ALALVVCCAVMAGAPVGRGHDVATQPLAIDAWPMERPIRTLFDAVLTGDPDAARRLLQEGADPNQRNPEGATPVMFVSPGAQAGYVAVADALIGAGADVNAVNNKGETAASLALRYGRMDALVRLLLAHGADANGRGAMSWTPLMEAARGDRLEIARLLVAAGAELGATDAHGETAAQVAAMSGASRTARFLMQMGGNTKEILGL